MSKPCKHRWHITAWSSGGQAYETCSRCGMRHERVLTSKEARDYRAWRKSQDMRIKAMHKPYRSFSAAIGDLGGYEAMEAAERWVAQHPGQAIITHVDDDHYASSSVVLVVHEDPAPRPQDVGGRAQEGCRLQ